MNFYQLILFLLILPIHSYSQIPATEIRAVWLTTNWGLDWPTIGADSETQKEELRVILDELQADNFNVILFQARAQGRVFYNSEIEQKSPYFNHENGFDPLAFAIEECHIRGMECHAWLVTYPVEKRQTHIGNVSVTNNKPDYYKAVDDRWYLDPGRPETHELILSIVKEIVTNYDIDGIHFDYIRYPDDPRKYPDQDTYAKYGNGKSLQDWRRGNITRLVGDIYDNVKSIKKWVQVSSSPLGRYRILPEVSRNDGWTAYDAVYQDAGLWMRSGKHDLIFPMMYHRNKHFYPFLDDWIANSNGRPVVPGLGVFQMSDMKWPLKDITNQMKYTRENNIAGQAYFRSGNILNNLNGVRDSIQSYYSTPAKLPPLSWLSNKKPSPPLDLEVYKDEEGYLNILWNAPDNDSYSFNVYVSYTEDIDTENAYNILATGVRGDGVSFRPSKGNFGLYYSVTACDRYHNESEICTPAFYVHSEDEK